MATIAPAQSRAIQLRHLPVDRTVSVLHRTTVAAFMIGAAFLTMCMLMLAIVLATPSADLRSPFVPGPVPQPSAEYGLGL